MPSSRSSGFPTTHPSFSRHRYSDVHRTAPPQIKLSIPTPVPAWASLPTPPMSGTPPPEPAFDPPQLAGRRRKREETPPVTRQEQQHSASSSTNISPLIEQTAPRHGDQTTFASTADRPLLPGPNFLPWDQPPSYSVGGGQGYALVTSNMPSRAPQISPRATRKVKAHVASACVNCKRKHLRCDETRPCRRCIQTGKEDTCRDVEHKKRGRPPLRDPGSESTRMLHGGVSLPPLESSSSRSHLGSGLAPILPAPMPTRAPYVPPYAPPSIAQSPATAQGQFSHTQRPVSFPPSRFPVSSTAYSGSGGMTLSYNYAASGQPPAVYQTSEYPTPLFPRRSVPSQLAIHHGSANYGPSPLQLPPILPAPPGTNTEPALAQQQQYRHHHHHQMQTHPAAYAQQAPSNMPPPAHTSSEERNPKRPKMDMRNILGPRE